MITFMETRNRHHFIDHRNPPLTLTEHFLLPKEFWPLLEAVYTDRITLSVRRKEDALFNIMQVYCAECVLLTD